MKTKRADSETQVPNDDSAIKRRGLFAAAWAAVIGLILKYTTEPVEAAASLQYANTTMSVSNTSFAPTVIIADETTYSTSGSVFTGQSVLANAMAGLQGVAGLRGSAPIRCGVFGESGLGSNAAGIMAYGNGDTVGLKALSDNGTAVLGQTSQFSSSNAITIYGVNNSTYAGPSPGAGGFAIYGLCAKGHGLVGATAAAGAAAVVGATNGVAGAYAAAFYGPVIVGGAFTVVNGPKSAAVPHPDGSHRRFYCMESPESWFEDFGSGRLDAGCAAVGFDPDFAAMVDLSSYHVFLTEYDAHNDLAVSDRTPAGFRVHAKNPAAKGEFSWRVVAKRKDIAGTRLEPVTIPPEPTLPPVPVIPQPAPRGQ
jgi:hypothetical protein